MSKYLWCSGATDVTGQALAEALNLELVKKKPRDLGRGDIVIGWGAKTKDNVNMGQAKVLNHPDKIRDNRNKFVTLQKLSEVRQLQSAINDFKPANEIKNAINRGDMVFPLVGRTNYHQGGKGFWLCLTLAHVDSAIQNGAQYFQSYADIDTEYRLHVAFGEVIYAQKKVENPTEEGWIAQRKEKIETYAQKNEVNLDNDTVNYVLNRLVKEAVLPDRIVRSNRRGWKFSSVAPNNIIRDLKNAAVKSVEAMGLDFGAVDCAKRTDGTPMIIEINSGPGLQRTAFDKYTEAFSAKIEELERGNIAQRAGRAARNAVRGNQEAAQPDAGDAPVQEAGGAGGGVINDAALAQLMNAVRTPDEARRVLDIAMGRG